jgi:hypothetical protein
MPVTGNMTYKINENSTRVLAAKQIKENLFVSLLHRNGKGVTQQEETNVSTLRMLKPVALDGDARELGAVNNGKFFNANPVGAQNVIEYDLNLLYIYDKMLDIPEVQEDLVPIDVFDAANKNIGGRIATEINASTIAHQLADRFNAAVTPKAWTNIAVLVGTGTKKHYDAVMSASTQLDDGDEANGIQAFPFEERELIMRPTFRQSLMSETGILLGGSNYAQSMIAKGGVSPDASKDYGNMYVGEIDLVPCYVCPKTIWNRAGVWAKGKAGATAFDNVEAVMCAASATDRGISTMDYVKVIDSPDGAGKRLQPKVRWGINVCYGAGVVPILKAGTAAPAAAMTVTAPGSLASAT